MINLNDERFNDKEVKVFNNGVAGVVKNCSVRVERKKPDDPDVAPEYKLFIIDETGAEINRGYFDNFDKNSDKANDFFVREMKHLAKVFRVEDQMPVEVNSYRELLDITMKLCNKNQSKIKTNAAVCYGNVDYPKRFLEIDGFWGLQNAEDNLPRLSAKAVTVRPQPDNNDDLEANQNEESDPLMDTRDDWDF